MKIPDEVLYQINLCLEDQSELSAWQKEAMLKRIAKIIGKEDILLNWWKEIDND